MDRSRPSKLLEFCSRQIHHIKQCGTNLQILYYNAAWNCMTNNPTNPLPFVASPNKYQTSKRSYSTSQKPWDSEGGDDLQIPHTFCT